MRTYSLKKEIFSLLCVTAAVSMAGATLSCAPQGLISLGNDGGAQSTGGASTGGSKSSESGGAAGKETDACAGKACGDSCSVCDEGPCPAIDLTCDGNGECGGLAACNAEESCEQGDTKKVDCNTCECTDGRWVCTDMACGVPKCEDGDVLPAEENDGCNSCSCVNGDWQCTLIACLDECEEGETAPATDGCNTCTCTEGKWACTERACEPTPISDSCVDKECGDYCSPCAPDEPCLTVAFTCDANGECGGTAACEIPECQGEARPAGDNCESCVCTEEGWTCPLSLCAVPECEEGDVRENECNSCTCQEGQWACDDGECAGRSCSDAEDCSVQEYCAFAEADGCGGEDASGRCEVRPGACTLDLRPVCGCDGKTYSNSCAAAALGVNVQSEGECDD